MQSSNSDEILIQPSIVKAQRMLSDYPYMAYHAKLQAYRELEFDNIVVSLVTEVLTYTQSNETHITKDIHNTITRPRFANPWEHFKASYAGRVWMRWYVRRVPIKFIEEKYNIRISVDIDLTQMLAFPEATYIYPKELGKPVVVVRRNSERVSWNGPVDNPLTDRW